MPTIKVKKEMNLPELIEWGFNNPELSKGKVYNIDDENDRFAAYVSFLPDVTGVRVPCTITQNNTFTVEVEEEITEYTKFSKLFAINEGEAFIKFNNSIDQFADRFEFDFYVMNDDRTLKLIWTKEEGLVV